MAVTSDNPISKAVIESAKRIIFRHTRLGAPRYSYNVEPIQLVTFINEIDRLQDMPGSILEIGVARGMTTRFVAEHLSSKGISDQKVYAIDTFASFVKEDFDYEVKSRGKSGTALAGFGYNDYDVWARNFRDYPFVIPVKSDCSTFDYSKVSPIKIAFLDVDLYLPTKKTLPIIYDALCPGGTILVDDVKDNSTYDGAYYAYMEFCKTRAIDPEVVGSKCGIIRKRS
jgi:hypothetical protein